MVQPHHQGWDWGNDESGASLDIYHTRGDDHVPGQLWWGRHCIAVCVAKGNLSRDTVTVILILVKTSDRFQCSIDNFCFDEMDPSLLLFSEGQSPRSIIRVVLALGSHEAGILFRSLRPLSEHDNSDD